MRDFRGPLPLTDADFAAIRANVLAKVQPRRPSLVWRFAFAAVIAAFVGLMSWNTPPAHVPTAAQSRPSPGPSLRSGPPSPRQAERGISQQLPSPRLAGRGVGGEGRIPPKPKPPEPDAPQFRMEIQTSDPDIRIIWLPSQTDDPKSNTLEEQSS